MADDHRGNRGPAAAAAYREKPAPRRASGHGHSEATSGHGPRGKRKHLEPFGRKDYDGDTFRLANMGVWAKPPDGFHARQDPF